MSVRRRALLIALVAAFGVLLVVAPSALAAEEGHAAFSWKSEALKVVNFLIVAGVLWWLLKDRLPAFLEERRKKIDQTIQEAKEARAEAEAKRAEYEAKIARAEQEIADIGAEGARKVEAMRADLARAAEAASERITSEAEKRIEAEVAKARADLQREASLLAVELSEELIRERMNDEDQKKLVDAALKKLEELS